MHIRSAHAAEADSLFDIWLRSVRATHAFLAEDDVQALIPLVRDYIDSGVQSFWVLADDENAPMGFMGMTGSEIDSLFVDPDHLRHGGGRFLVNHARTLSPTLTVSVNEQNPTARKFYEACGFVVAGRSETGRPRAPVSVVAPSFGDRADAINRSGVDAKPRAGDYNTPMLATLRTFSLLGIDALAVEVEVDVSDAALPKTVLVGLPEAAVKESTHRVERALVNSGYQRPTGRVVINLAPAELPKQAASFDLPITLGILAASGQFTSEIFSRYAVVGELALDGSTRPVKGALSMALAAKQLPGLKGLIVPRASAREAAVVEGIDVIPIGSLSEAVAFLAGAIQLEPVPSGLEELFHELGRYEADFADVRGQEMAKRAITVAAAGGHNILMLGPPGSGKTMLAKRIPTILPEMAAIESIETSRIYSAMGLLPPGQPLMVIRPFRSPHHTISDAGLVGGGSIPAPGEISLSHHGVLFLDELPEFNRRTLEVLRQPLEDGTVTISRALSSTTFPAMFMLVAALNPCPCGYRNDPRRECHCTPIQIERYMAKISGPLLDRIDIHLEVPAVPYKELSSTTPGTSSAVMREQVSSARTRQETRFHGSRTRQNARMTHKQNRTFCTLDPVGQNLLKTAVTELGLSARAHDKVLRVARTIADLDASDTIQPQHVSEAINYRMLDRSLWK